MCCDVCTTLQNMFKVHTLLKIKSACNCDRSKIRIKISVKSFKRLRGGGVLETGRGKVDVVSTRVWKIKIKKNV